jgi:ankyrin repeat protein
MKKKNFIDKVRVNDPCTQAWDDMIGNDTVRFCTHCAKDVNNLSAMTRKEAVRLVRRSGGSLCIRYVQQPATKGPMFAEQLTQITRRVPRMAAGVMSASLSLATMTYAQGGTAPVPSANYPAAARVSECEDGGIIGKKKPGVGDAAVRVILRGTVSDIQGAVVPNVAVTLNDEKANVIGKTRTDDDGSFRFEGLTTGKYSLRTEADRGFDSTLIENISVVEGDTAIDVTINITAQSVQLMGVVASGPEFEGALAIAVSNDDLEEATRLISHGENANRKEADGTTPLFIAVENGNVEMVRLLLDAGAKINARNDKKETPIMQLDEDASPELVELLLRFGARTNDTSKSRDTALITSVGRRAKPEVVKALIDAGAQLDVQNEDGMTALMYAVDLECLETARLLVFAGANVNLRDNDKESAWDKTSDDELETLLESYGAVTTDEPGTTSDPQP